MTQTESGSETLQIRKVGDFKMEIMDVIKYNGRPDVFAWKYPGEELGTWSQLVVNQSQEAVLVKGGSVADVFGPGTHTLDTKNIPILNKIINLPFGWEISVQGRSMVY